MPSLAAVSRSGVAVLRHPATGWRRGGSASSPSSSGDGDHPPGLALANGGSFVFRGNRYELIEPEPQAGQPFLRVAMGYRGGSDRDRIVDLFRELAALPALPR